jgi:hypothetical protein
MGTINIFVSNDYGFGFVLGDNRLHRFRVKRLAVSSQFRSNRRFPTGLSLVYTIK